MGLWCLAGTEPWSSYVEDSSASEHWEGLDGPGGNLTPTYQLLDLGVSFSICEMGITIVPASLSCLMMKVVKVHTA